MKSLLAWCLPLAFYVSTRKGLLLYEWLRYIQHIDVNSVVTSYPVNRVYGGVVEATFASLNMFI